MEMLHPLPSFLSGSCLATMETRKAHARHADMNKRLISCSRVLMFSSSSFLFVFFFLYAFFVFMALLCKQT